jgi:hypothetical protein
MCSLRPPYGCRRPEPGVVFLFDLGNSDSEFFRPCGGNHFLLPRCRGGLALHLEPLASPCPVYAKAAINGAPWSRCLMPFSVMFT